MEQETVTIPIVGSLQDVIAEHYGKWEAKPAICRCPRCQETARHAYAAAFQQGVRWALTGNAWLAFQMMFDENSA
jgi:hypothetical protein